MTTRGITDLNYGLPSHLSEATFRRYESFIATAVANAPTDTSFTIPDGVAPTTFVARLRDATFSLKKFNWSPTSVDLTKLWTLTGKMVWSYDSATKLIWYRERQPRGRPSELTSEANSHIKALTSAASIRWESWTEAELRALCMLLHTKKLIGPYILKGEVNQFLLTDLESSHDVSFVIDTQSNETILT
jgi:hypothetical protein